jgi:two-component system NtrC family response regulator
MEKTTAKVLVIDDERSVCVTCRRILESEGHTVEYTLSGLEGIRMATQGDYDVVLLDLKMPDVSGMEALEQIRAARPDLTVVIITGYATIQTSIEAVRKGAFDYIPKPFTPEELTLALQKALEDRRLRSENEYLKQELTALRKGTPIIGRSRAMEDIVHQVLKIAPTDFTVTIYGESGTGKDLIAQAIHENSRRADKPFVGVDLSALSPTLLESELFGHVKGAFTGATQNRPGYFAIANGGTLFLDEVANISLELQGKLLRVLESHQVRPVGSEREQEVDVRVVTATNRDLAQLVEEGKLREDLYYRFNVIPMIVPPLRERTEDIPLLAEHFLQEAKKRSGTNIRGFASETMAKMLAYHWPGNVRELRNVVERMVATADGDLILPPHLPTTIHGRAPAPPDEPQSPIPATVEELKRAKRRLKETVFDGMEKRFVLHALERAGWNVTHAAQLVGMARPNFHTLMRRYGIKGKGEQNGG